MSAESPPLELPENAAASPRGATEAGWIMAGLAFVAMLSGIFAYGMWGDRITQGLDQACAEAAFKKGQQLEAIGNHEGALQQFRQAMEGHFATEAQRYMCGRSIGELLSRSQRYAEAAEAYAALPPEALSESGHYTAYVLSLWHSGRLEEAARLGAVWLRLAETEQSAEQILWAHNALMHIAGALNNKDDVLRHGEAILQLDPDSAAALTVARALLNTGDATAALTQVNAFIETTRNPAHLEEAKRLRATITAAR